MCPRGGGFSPVIDQGLRRSLRRRLRRSAGRHEASHQSLDLGRHSPAIGSKSYLEDRTIRKELEHIRSVLEGETSRTARAKK
jgi:hypothetical protein